VQEDGAGRKTPADTAACYMLEALNAAASPTLYSLLAVACHTPVVRVRLRLEEGDAMMGRGDGTVKGIRGRPLHSLLAAADRRSRHGGTPRFVASARRTDHGDTCRWLLAPGKAAAALVELLAASGSGSGALNRHGRFKSHHDLVDQNR